MKGELNKEQLEKHLARLSKKALIAEVGILFENFAEVKQYYQTNYGAAENREQILEPYKNKIDEVFSTNGQSSNITTTHALQTLIDDFHKIATDKVDIVSLLLYRVKQTVAFIERFGEMEEGFYTATENAFSYALIIIDENGLEDVFSNTIYDIVGRTQNMNWFFHHTLKNLYEEIYGVFS